MLTPVLLAQAAPPPVVLFTELDASLQSVFAAFLGPTVANLTSALQTTALLGATIYLLFLGFTIVFGADSTPFYTVFRTSFKIVFVAALSLSASGYQSFIVGGIQGLEDGLVSTMHIAKSTGSAESVDNIAQFLDATMGLGFTLAKACFELGVSKGMFSPGSALAWVFLGLIFGLSTAVLVIIGGAMVLLTKFALTILFALGPLFVLSLMFPQTESFFYKWLGEALSFVFQNVIIAAVLSFALAQFINFAAKAAVQGDNPMNPLIAALQVLVVACVMAYLLVKSGAMGAALSGGMSASLLSPQGVAQTAASIAKGGAGAVSKSASVAKVGAGAVGKVASASKRMASAFQRAMNWLGGRSEGWSASQGSRSTSSALDRLISPSKNSSAAKEAVASRPTSEKPAGRSLPAESSKGGTKSPRSKAFSRFVGVAASKARTSKRSAPSPGKPTAPNPSGKAPPGPGAPKGAPPSVSKENSNQSKYLK